MRAPHLTRVAPPGHYAHVMLTTSAPDLRCQLTASYWWWPLSRVEVAVDGR